MKYAKSVITGTLIISILIMFYPTYSYSYSYSYSVFNYNLEEKNNNSQLLNKIIEPTFNYVSLEEVDIDIDDQDVACFENDDDEIVCLDKDDLDSNDLDDLLNFNNLDDLNLNDNDDLKCFENDDDETVCFDKNAINNDDSLFNID